MWPYLLPSFPNLCLFAIKSLPDAKRLFQKLRRNFLVQDGKNPFLLPKKIGSGVGLGKASEMGEK